MSAIYNFACMLISIYAIGMIIAGISLFSDWRKYRKFPKELPKGKGYEEPRNEN